MSYFEKRGTMKLDDKVLLVVLKRMEASPLQCDMFADLDAKSTIAAFADGLKVTIRTFNYAAFWWSQLRMIHDSEPASANDWGKVAQALIRDGTLMMLRDVPPRKSPLKDRRGGWEMMYRERTPEEKAAYVRPKRPRAEARQEAIAL